MVANTGPIKKKINKKNSIILIENKIQIQG